MSAPKGVKTKSGRRIFDQLKKFLDSGNYNDLNKNPDGSKVGRNDPCPCRSGKKFKSCCS